MYQDNISALLGTGQDPREQQLAQALRGQQAGGDMLGLSTIGSVSNLGQNINARTNAAAKQGGQLKQARQAAEAKRLEDETARAFTSEQAELNRTQINEQGVLNREHDISIAAQQQGHELVKQSQRFQGEAGLQLTKHEQNLVTGAIDNGYNKAMKILDFDQSKATAAQRQDYDKELRNMIQTFTTAERESAQKYSSSENVLDREQTLAISLMRDALENKRIDLQKTVQEHGMSSEDARRREYLENQLVLLNEEKSFWGDSDRVNNIEAELDALNSRKPSRWEQLKSAF
jgi:hypothetical protein